MFILLKINGGFEKKDQIDSKESGKKSGNTNQRKKEGDVGGSVQDISISSKSENNQYLNSITNDSVVRTVYKMNLKTKQTFPPPIFTPPTYFQNGVIG